MNLVIDASSALAWLFERNKPTAVAIAERTLNALSTATTWVPPLWHIEIANALLVGERLCVVTEAQVIDYLSRLLQLLIVTDDIEPRARRDVVMLLAREHGLTANDATYLELALRTDAELATFDVPLANAMRRAGARVFGDGH